MKIPFEAIPYTYLLPVCDFSEIRMAVYEAYGKTMSLNAPLIAAAANEFNDNADDLDVTWAGAIGLEGASIFAEHYDPERFRLNEQYLEEDTITTIMALPAMRDTLLLLKASLDSLIANPQALYTDPAYGEIIAQLRALVPLFRLPKLPLEIKSEPVDDSEGDYTFTVGQYYGKHYFPVFLSADGVAERDELLQAFLFYHRFCTILPAFLLRLDEQEGTAILLSRLMDLQDGFSAAEQQYNELVLSQHFA